MFSTDTVIQSENLLLFDILKIRRNILSVCTPEYDFYEDLSLIRGLMAIMLDKELECWTCVTKYFIQEKSIIVFNYYCKKVSFVSTFLIKCSLNSLYFKYIVDNKNNTNRQFWRLRQTLSLVSDLAVVLVIRHFETFNTDVVVFIGDVIMWLISNFQYQRLSKYLDTDNITRWDQKKNVQIIDRIYSSI